MAISHIRHATQGTIQLSNTQPVARVLGGRTHVLGHWGTTPGLNFIYVHLNRVITQCTEGKENARYSMGNESRRSHRHLNLHQIEDTGLLFDPVMSRIEHS